MSARVVMVLQTLVSREDNPADPVVITVGSINGRRRAEGADGRRQAGRRFGVQRSGIDGARGRGREGRHRQQNVSEMPAKMRSEDFANYGQAGVKGVLLHVGAVEPGKLAAARKEGKYALGTHAPRGGEVVQRKAASRRANGMRPFAWCYSRAAASRRRRLRA